MENKYDNGRVEAPDSSVPDVDLSFVCVHQEINYLVNFSLLSLLEQLHANIIFNNLQQLCKQTTSKCFGPQTK